MSPIRPATVTPTRRVPASIPRPPYVGREAPDPYTGDDAQDADTVERMRRAGRLAADALGAVAAAVAPGITTDELDRIGHEYLLDHGAYPSTLGYRGYPKSVCTSVNEVICHGIPDTRPLEDGDLVSIDLTAYLDGVHGDTCTTVACGGIDEASRLLLERTAEATARGIRAIKPGRPVNVIGRVIESYARRFGYTVIRDYTGHGVHTSFHSGLVVPHHDDPTHDTVLRPGMTLTVEPMISLGATDAWEQWDDGWTVVTADRSRVAQFEHTVVVTDSGAEILTLASNAGTDAGG